MLSISTKYLTIVLFTTILLLLLVILTASQISHSHLVNQKILAASELMSILHGAAAQLDPPTKTADNQQNRPKKIYPDFIPEVEGQLQRIILTENLWVEKGSSSHRQSHQIFLNIYQIWRQEIKPEYILVYPQLHNLSPTDAGKHKDKLVKLDRMIDRGIQQLITEVNEENRTFYNFTLAFLAVFTSIFMYTIYFIHYRLINPILIITKKINATKEGTFNIRFTQKFEGKLNDLAESITVMGDTITDLLKVQKADNTKARIFNEITQQMTDSSDLEKMLTNAIEQARIILGADYGAISLLKEDNTHHLFIPAGIDAVSLAKMKRQFNLPQGKGLLGHLMLEGQPILLDNIAAHPASVGFPIGHPAMKSFIGTPIILDKKVIGRIYFSNQPGNNGFVANDLELANSFASSVALAINNINILKALNNKKNELDILNRLSTVVSSSLCREEITQKALNEIMGIDTLQAEKQGVIFLHNEGDDFIWLAAHKNLPDELVKKDQKVPLGECICGLAAQNKEIILSKNSCDDQRHTRGCKDMTCHGHICLPLKTEETLHGVVNFYLAAGTDLSASQIDLFKAIADIISMALNNAANHNRAAKLAQAMESSQDLITITDSQGDITYINPVSEDFSGYKTYELIGKPISIIQSPNNPEELEEEINTATQNDRGWSGEVLNTHKDGHEYPVFLTTAPIKDEAGNIIAMVGISQDITELKKSEKKLRQSEERLARAQSIAHLGNWEWDIVNNKLFWSDEIYRIFGLSPQQFAGTYEAFLKMAHPDDREHIEESIRKALKEQTAYSMDHRIVLPDQSVRIVQEQAVVEFDQDNKPLKMTGTIQDITERQAVEETLRRLSERLTMATRSAGLGIWDWDIENDILSCDELMHQLYGMSIGSFGKEYEAWIQSIHPDDRERVKDEIRAALENRTQFNSQFRIVWPGGKTIKTIRGVFAAHCDRNNNPHRMIGVQQDITEIVESHAKTKQSEEKFKRLMENLEGTYFFYSHDPNGIYTYISPSVTGILGYTPIEYLQHFTELLTDHPGNKDVAENTNSSIKGTLQPPYMVEVYHKDGSKKWLQIKETTVVDLNDKVISIEGIAQDITERKAAEQELEWHRNNLEELVELRTNELEIAKKMAENANQAKSDFLANMSHELRTPLNAIIGFSELMGRGMAGELADTQKEYIADINTSGKHLLSLINDILDLSKVEAGMMELDLAEFRICELIEQSLVMFKEKAMKHNVKVDVEGNEGLPPLMADERKIKQVLFNLFSNAFKYTPDGGHIVVDVGLEVIDTEEYIQVAVIDNGVGIPLAAQNTLFQPFQQVDHYLTKKHKGTGLGLSLCKSFVELHGGRIRVESEPNQGSSFIFTLPIKQNKQLEYHL